MLLQEELNYSVRKCATKVGGLISMGPKDCSGKKIVEDKIEQQITLPTNATNAKSSMHIVEVFLCHKNVLTMLLELFLL